MEVRKLISYNLSDYPFHYDLQTRWRDMDAFGHVNNSVFLNYIEDARVTFFKRWNLFDENQSIIVASIKIDYIRQMAHPSNLIVGQKISSIGKKSFDIASVMLIKDEVDPVASSIVTCVCFDYENNKSVPVYPQIIADYRCR